MVTVVVEHDGIAYSVDADIEAAEPGNGLPEGLVVDSIRLCGDVEDNDISRVLSDAATQKLRALTWREIYKIRGGEHG